MHDASHAMHMALHNLLWLCGARACGTACQCVCVRERMGARRCGVAAGPWHAAAPCGSEACKRALAKLKREHIFPDMLLLFTSHGPLAWVWLAAHGGVTFVRHTFELCWQLRTLVMPHPHSSCPWCSPFTSCNKVHLEMKCPRFGMKSWASIGIGPEETFIFLVDANWFTVVLQTCGAFIGVL